MKGAQSVIIRGGGRDPLEGVFGSIRERGTRPLCPRGSLCSGMLSSSCLYGLSIKYKTLHEGKINKLIAVLKFRGSIELWLPGD